MFGKNFICVVLVSFLGIFIAGELIAQPTEPATAITPETETASETDASESTLLEDTTTPAGHPVFQPGFESGGASVPPPDIEICVKAGYVCDAYCDTFWGACVHGYSSICWQDGCMLF